MGGGATYIEIPMIQFKTSSAILPSLSPPLPSSSSTLNFPACVNNASPLRQYCGSVSCRYCHSENENRLYNDIFGPVPSQLEVETATSALQNFLQGICSTESEFMRLQQLLTEPIIKRLVISLSSDKAVWGALMNNEAMRRLRESYLPSAHNHRLRGCCNEEPDVFTCALRWIMDIAKAKVSELVHKFELLMNQIFQLPESGKQAEESKDKMDDRVSSSFLLSLVILLIVIVARFHRV